MACTFRRRAAVVVAAAALVLAACTGQQAEDAPALPADAPQVLLLAVDGLEWTVVLPLLRAGELPVLESLMSRGRYGLLTTFEPTLSPAIWTSIATGKDIRAHGISGFRYEDPDDPEKKPLFTNADRRTKAFWNILGDHGRRVNLIGWFLTFPVEPIEGVMVAQTNTLSAEDFVIGAGPKKGVFLPGIQGQVWPEERLDEMAEIFFEIQQGTEERNLRIFGSFPHEPGEFESAVWEKCQWALRADATYAEIGARLAGEAHADVTAVYFGGADVLGHRFWRYMRPAGFENQPAPEQVENFAEVVRDYYRHLDGVFGELIRAFPEEPTVLLVSDHGMHGVNRDSEFVEGAKRRYRISGGHGDAPAGVLIAAGRGIAPPYEGAPGTRTLRKSALPTVGTVYDITPTLLALLDVPVGEDMRGEVMTQLVDPAWLAAHPVRTVATHDTEEWRASRPEAPVIDEDTEERLEQLRQLGYIE